MRPPHTRAHTRAHMHAHTHTHFAQVFSSNEVWIFSQATLAPPPALTSVVSGATLTSLLSDGKVLVGQETLGPGDACSGQIGHATRLWGSC